MTESLNLPAQWSRTWTVGSRTFEFSLINYSNRVFICISEQKGNPGTIFSVKKDSPMPDPDPLLGGILGDIFTVKTLFGAESEELLLGARVLGSRIGQFIDKPLILALALADPSTSTIRCIEEQIKDLFKSL